MKYALALKTGQLGRASAATKLKGFWPGMQAAASPNRSQLVDRSGNGNNLNFTYTTYSSGATYTAGQVVVPPVADGFVYVVRLAGTVHASNGWITASASAATGYITGAVVGGNEFSDGTVTFTKIADPYAIAAGWTTIVKHPSVTTDIGLHLTGIDWDLNVVGKRSLLLCFEINAPAPSAAAGFIATGTPGMRVVTDTAGNMRVVVTDGTVSIDTGYQALAMANGTARKVMIFVDGVDKKIYPSINNTALPNSYGLSIATVTGSTQSNAFHLGCVSLGGISQNAAFRNVGVYVGDFTLENINLMQLKYLLNPNMTLSDKALV